MLSDNITGAAKRNEHSPAMAVAEPLPHRAALIAEKLTQWKSVRNA